MHLGTGFSVLINIQFLLRGTSGGTHPPAQRTARTRQQRPGLMDRLTLLTLHKGTVPLPARTHKIAPGVQQKWQCSQVLLRCGGATRTKYTKQNPLNSALQSGELGGTILKSPLISRGDLILCDPEFLFSYCCRDELIPAETPEEPPATCGTLSQHQPQLMRGTCQRSS